MAQNDEGATAPPDPNEYAGPIQNFFQQVAQGVIRAQQSLDRESEKYLNGRPPISLPTVFRIPKVTAEFMLAAEKGSEAGIKFIVAVSKTRREAMQQKLSFEIAAVPPPVDVLASLPPKDTSTEDIEAALAKVEDDEQTANLDERAIAGLLSVKQESCLRIDLPQCWMLIHSPQPEPGKDRVLYMAVIDREGDQPAKIYTNDSDFVGDVDQASRTIVAALAELAGQVSDV